MRTRRSRFFVILLHVVGVSHSSLFHWNTVDSTNNYNHHNSNQSHVSTSTSVSPMGVEPNSMALQYIDYYEELLQINENPHSHQHPKWKFWKSFRRRKQSSSRSSTTTFTPIWLQDPSDGLCLGPMSTFSECGDATLWFVTIQYDLPPSNKLELLSGIPIASTSTTTPTTSTSIDRHSVNHLPQPPAVTAAASTTTRIQPTNTRIGLTFRVVDQDFELSGTTRRHTSTTTTTTTTSINQRIRRERRRQHELPEDAECLDADPNQDLSVQVRQCRYRGGYIWQRKHVRSSVWTVNTNGILQPFDAGRTMATTKSKSKPVQHDSHRPSDVEHIPLCLTRNATRAILAHCDETHPPIQFLFLRYYPTGTSSAVNIDTHNVDRRRTLQQREEQQIQPQYEPNKLSDASIHSASTTRIKNAASNLETPKKGSSTNGPVDEIISIQHRDRAHDVAASMGPLMHPDLKIASRLMFTGDPSNSILQPRTSRDTTTNEKNTFKPSPLALALSNTNPFLLATMNNKNGGGSSSTSSVPSKNPSLMIYPTSAAGGDTTTNIKVSKLRRMQTHPYLNEAKDGIWTDPQTNLQYNTDLCRYLGRNRQEHGRHTLTGFGIYRKGYVIKVYGIAYYVSKRDVLTDPAFEPYATMTAEQLKQRPDFYEVLRTMRDPSSSSHKAGYFDRTIMLKTNMQLSTETMRSSLEADWSYLTDEAKRTLVDASMQEQAADDAMLEFIQSPDNPSRCSCSQVAPPEYKANPDCCARGTELVFTWTKANELEVRLNGRLMDIFPRPDIAEGIFYEYLRYDNPISPEFVDRVVDGFPFLLGPLAQIRGIHIGQSSTPTQGTTNENAVLSAMFGFRDFVLTQTTTMSEMTKQSMLDAADHIGQMSKMLVESATDMAKEADRRRDLLVKHTVAAPEVFMKLLARDEATIQYFVRWMSGQPEPEVIGVDHNNVDSPLATRPRGPRGRTFGYPLSRWFGEDIYYSPDEIEPMTIHPTINRVILTLVHLYLLLLFIVSFPGSYSTRTKILHRRYHHREPSLDDSDSDTISDYDTNSNVTIVGVSDGCVKVNKNIVMDDDDEDGTDQLLRQYDQQLRYPYATTTTKRLQRSCIGLPPPPPRIRNTDCGNNTPSIVDAALVVSPVIYHSTPRRRHCPPNEYTTSRTNHCNSGGGSSGGMKKKSLSYFL